MSTQNEALVSVPQELAVPAVCDVADRLQIVDADSYEQGGVLLTTIKARLRAIADLCDLNIKRWHDGHKAAVAQKKGLAAPYEAAEATVKGRMGVFARAEEEKRRAIERAAQEAAALAEAEQAEALGDAEGAERALNGHGAASVSIPSAVPKLEGVSIRENWRAEIVSLKELARAVADGQVPETLIEGNMKALNQMARALKKELRVPGVRAVSSTGIAAGGAR